MTDAEELTRVQRELSEVIDRLSPGPSLATRLCTMPLLIERIDALLRAESENAGFRELLNLAGRGNLAEYVIGLIGGTVNGEPTTMSNFGHRLDELLTIERSYLATATMPSADRNELEAYRKATCELGPEGEEYAARITEAVIDRGVLIAQRNAHHEKLSDVVTMLGENGAGEMTTLDNIFARIGGLLQIEEGFDGPHPDTHDDVKDTRQLAENIGALSAVLHELRRDTDDEPLTVSRAIRRLQRMREIEDGFLTGSTTANEERDLVVGWLENVAISLELTGKSGLGPWIALARDLAALVLSNAHRQTSDTEPEVKT